MIQPAPFWQYVFRKKHADENGDFEIQYLEDSKTVYENC